MRFSLLLLCVVLLTQCRSSKVTQLFEQGGFAHKEHQTSVTFDERLGLAIVPIEIKGKTYRFLFDTGAHNIVSEKVAKALDLPSSGTLRARDSNGTLKQLPVVRIDTFYFGDQPVIGTNASVYPLDASLALSCLEIDGILGGNTFKSSAWRIDFANQTISVNPSRDTWTNTGRWDSMKVTVGSSYHLTTDLKVDSFTIKNVKLDYGYSRGLALPAEHYSKLKKLLKRDDDRLGFAYGSSGLFGQGKPDTTRALLLSDVAFGSLKDPRLVVRPSKKALLGCDFFRNYVVVLDYPHRTAYLQAQPKRFDRPFVGLGFSAQKVDSAVVCAALIENSPAALAGLTVGDTILAIDGLEFEGMDIPTFCDFMCSDWSLTQKVQLRWKQAGTIRETALESTP